jgi:hypothetical protein
MHHTIRTPLAFAKEVGSLIEFRHEVDFGLTVSPPVAHHLANG